MYVTTGMDISARSGQLDQISPAEWNHEHLDRKANVVVFPRGTFNLFSFTKKNALLCKARVYCEHVLDSFNMVISVMKQHLHLIYEENICPDYK